MSELCRMPEKSTATFSGRERFSLRVPRRVSRCQPPAVGRVGKALNWRFEHRKHFNRISNIEESFSGHNYWLAKSFKTKKKTFSRFAAPFFRLSTVLIPRRNQKLWSQAVTTALEQHKKCRTKHKHFWAVCISSPRFPNNSFPSSDTSVDSSSN